MSLSALFAAGRKWIPFAFTLITSVAVAQSPAQTTCQQMIAAALQSTSAACEATSRNQVCYGNSLNIATPAAGITDLRFEQAGDRVELSSVASIRLSPLDDAAQQWGIALMRVQANLPDTLPGQNVTFLIFGDVTLDTPFRTSASDDGSSPQPAPPQAYHFSTGIGQLSCAGAPSDGMIVQTPKGVGMVTFTLNGVEIALGSTAVISQSSSGAVSVALLEGNAIVKANGASQILVPGAETQALPQSDDPALRFPSSPKAIHSEQFAVVQQALSVLPRAVEVPAPAKKKALIKAARKSSRIAQTDVDFLNGCARPAGWQTYKIRGGDTLSRIAGAAQTTIEALMAANCLADARFIVSGRDLFVPNHVDPPASGGGPVGAAPNNPAPPTKPRNGGNGNGNGNGNGHDHHDHDHHGHGHNHDHDRDDDDD